MHTTADERTIAERIAAAFVAEAGGKVRHIGRKGMGQPGRFEVLDPKTGKWAPDLGYAVPNRVRALSILASPRTAGYRQTDMALHSLALALAWTDPPAKRAPKPKMP